MHCDGRVCSLVYTQIYEGLRSAVWTGHRSSCIAIDRQTCFHKDLLCFGHEKMLKRRKAGDIVMERGWSMGKEVCNCCCCYMVAHLLVCIHIHAYMRVQCIMHALNMSAARVHHYVCTCVEEKTCCTVIHLLVGEVSQSANRQSAPLLPGNHWQIRCNLAHLTKTSPLND